MRGNAVRRCRLICGIRTPALSRGIVRSGLWLRLQLPAHGGANVDDEVQVRRMNQGEAFYLFSLLKELEL